MSPWMRPSTLDFFRRAKAKKNYPVTEWLHGWFYMRFPYAYIGNGLGARQPAKLWLRLRALWQRWFPPKAAPEGISKGGLAWAEGYHGKVIPLQSAREWVTVREPIAAALPEQVIPFQHARDMILEMPDHLALLDCPCRAARENPCLPVDVCLIVGEPFVSMVVEHHPQRSRRVSSAEALAVLEAEERRGHVHHAFFKEALLGRFYAICNCCSCCCGAMQAQRSGTPMLIASGYRAQVEDDLCAGCGECEAVCPFGAVSAAAGTAQVDAAACMGCGVCVSHCPQEALALVLDPQKGAPLEVHSLISAPPSC